MNRALHPLNLRKKNYCGKNAGNKSTIVPSTRIQPEQRLSKPPTNTVFTKLIPEIQQALNDQGYNHPTPIQEQSIVPLLKGRDLLGSAQTGTGKTATFVLPILQFLTIHKKLGLRGKPRVLILAPTRELAAQIGDSITTYSRYLHVTRTVIFGGVKQAPQVNSLNRGKHIVVATPGRLLDLMNQGHICLKAIEMFVLDEADRMLDMGFLPDIRAIIKKLPQQRQSLFFSATMPSEVVKLAKSFTHNPIEVSISPEKPTVEKIDQKVFFIDQKKKIKLLVDMLKSSKLNKVLVFTKMKHRANKISDKLNAVHIKSEAIHGNKTQSARMRSLDSFKRRKVQVLVATDIAARGIDVDHISLVINYDLPNEPECYIHRIGRTARAGAKGDAISFCSAEERNSLRDIEKLILKKIPVEIDHDYHSNNARLATGDNAKPKPKKISDKHLHSQERANLLKETSYSNGKRHNKRKRSFKVYK